MVRAELRHGRGMSPVVLVWLCAPSVRRYLYVCAYACAVVSLARRSRGVRPGLARVAVEWCVLLRWDVHDTPPVPRVGGCGNTVVSVRTVPALRVVHYPQFPSCM